MSESDYTNAIQLSTRNLILRRRLVRSLVFFSPSLTLFHFFILVFHLEQKHEEGQRLLHYLRQTNTSSLSYLTYVQKRGNL